MEDTIMRIKKDSETEIVTDWVRSTTVNPNMGMLDMFPSKRSSKRLRKYLK